MQGAIRAVSLRHIGDRFYLRRADGSAVRAGLDPDEALRRLRDGAGSQWDAEIVGAFIHLIDQGIVSGIQQEQLAGTRVH